jgi:hypothetical protein
MAAAIVTQTLEDRKEISDCDPGMIFPVRGHCAAHIKAQVILW